MRRIREEMAELSKSCRYWPDIPEREYRDVFKKNFLRIIHDTYKSTQFLTLIPNMILVLNRIVAL